MSQPREARGIPSVEGLHQQSKKTLGQVMGELTENVLMPNSPAADEVGEDDDPGDFDEIRFRTRFNIEVPVEHHEDTLVALRALVDLRNELVHHFLEKHDIWTESGCVEAQAYLDACYEQVDERYMELHAWAKSSVEAREYMASLMQTPEFMDFILHGILPAGAGVEWECSTIVKLLRKAETALAQDNWTSLSDAIASIQKEHPEHTPRRYGCSSWRQVLHESRQFLVRKERTDPNRSTKIWYRSEDK
ncbi:OST-HTH/LOTUS domain-containing protein [Aromatoleum toluolicum]|uniref:HTH OST-type domain-containing protein n=1 Tax=Aromatoleum toluolicum TaxID=90060 RepID=A0ABX1NB07_9RHOO|nr:OST-HTH/LOTUS domain-containing protein [Aromatoleum toluolicum]NMF96452.1 OST-HTH/LOTUS domain-containing protein [Aromatoleum toluolicum]